MKGDWDVLKGGVIVASGAQGFFMLSGFFVAILLARWVPRDDLGAFYLLVQVATVAGLIALVGTNSSMQKFVGVASKRKDWREVRHILRTAAPIQWVGWILTSLILGVIWIPLCAVLSIPVGLDTWAMAVCLSGVIALTEHCTGVFRAWRDFRYGTWLRTGVRQGLMLLGLLLVYGTGVTLLDFETSIGLRIATTALPAVIAWWLMRRHLRSALEHSVESSTPATVSRSVILSTSIPMAIHGLTVYLVASVDMWVVGAWLGNSDAGLYGTILRIAMLLGALLTVINAVLPTLVAGLFEEKKFKELEHLLRRTASASGVCALAAFLGLVVVGAPMLRLLFGPGFEDGYLVMVLLAVGQLLNIGSGSPGWVLQMTGQQAVLAKITLVTLVVNITLNLLLVGPFGLEGVAAATALGIVAQNAMMIVAVKKLVGIRTYTYFNPLLMFRNAR